MGNDISLVLASGGARGLAHIGVIEEIENQGYNISSIAGSSMGALIGGVYASGKLPEFISWIQGYNKQRILGLMDLTISANGIVKGDKILKALKKIVPENKIENLRIPYVAVATDIISHHEVVFSSGSLYDAIRASISIPSFFKPCKRNNMVLVDGGVINPLPIDCAKRKAGDLLVAVDVNAPIEMKKQYIKEQKLTHSNSIKLIDRILQIPDEILKWDIIDLNYYTLLAQSSRVMIQRITELNLELHKPDVLIEIPMNACRALEFHRFNEMIEIGRTAAKKALSQL